MGYIWKEFGILTDVAFGDKYVIVTNKEHQFRKIALYTYKESALNVRNKAQLLIGKRVSLRTSQNTDKWPPEIWFSEIKEITY